MPYLIIFLLYFYQIASSQVPSGAIAPEDAAFNNKYSKADIPTVSGKLLNLADTDRRQLTITYTLVTPFAVSQVMKTALPTPDGDFKLELDYPLPYQQIWLSVGNYFYAGLYANTDLYVELDMKQIKDTKEVAFNGDGVRYLGTDGPLNLYMNNYVLYKRNEKDELSSKISALNTNIDKSNSTVNQYDELFDSAKKIEEEYISANSSPYSWLLENERMSDYYAQLCASYWQRIMPDSLFERIKKHKSYLLSNASTQYFSNMSIYLNFLSVDGIKAGWKDLSILSDLNAGDKALIDSLKESEKLHPAYSCKPEDIEKWKMQLRPRIQQLTILRSLDKTIQKVDSLFPTAKADFMKLGMNSSLDIIEQKLMLERLLLDIHTPWCAEVAANEFRRTAQSIDKIHTTLAMSSADTHQTGLGKPLFETPFGASMYNATGMKTADLLAKLKKSFPDKAIIIDRWATWCAPCISEMPQSKKLQETSKDMPVVFVYLCTLYNSTENKWKIKVTEMEQPGIHLLIDEALDAEISGLFKFNGYPGYALIDKSGNYRPGAINNIWDITDKKALYTLINK